MTSLNKQNSQLVGQWSTFCDGRKHERKNFTIVAGVLSLITKKIVSFSGNPLQTGSLRTECRVLPWFQRTGSGGEPLKSVQMTASHLCPGAAEVMSSPDTLFSRLFTSPRQCVAKKGPSGKFSGCLLIPWLLAHFSFKSQPTPSVWVERHRGRQ